MSLLALLHLNMSHYLPHLVVFREHEQDNNLHQNDDPLTNELVQAWAIID